MKQKAKKHYTLRADISLQSEKVIKKAQANLVLQDKPHNIEDAVNLICSEYDKLKK